MLVVVDVANLLSVLVAVLLIGYLALRFRTCKDFQKPVTGGKIKVALIVRSPPF